MVASIATASPSHTRVMRFGVFELDLEACELRKQTRRVKLQVQPCQVLKMLLERPGEVVSREELCRRLWPSDTFVDFEHSLNTAVRRLREALSDSPENPVFIETLQRRGYRFIAPVTQTPISKDEAVSVEAAQSSKAIELQEIPAIAGPGVHALVFHPAGGKGEYSLAGWAEAIAGPAWMKVAAFGLVAITLGVVVGSAIHHPAPDIVANPDVPRAVGQVRSLVVLPLNNLSGSPDQDYLADGMTDELIARLAKVKRLRVISRTSSMNYKGTHKSLSAIAHELNVDAVVEGTVIRSKDHVRITAELVQISSDRALWAEVYESELSDILSLQRQVANDIVGNIQIEVSPKEQQALVATHTVNTEAYEDYLKGRYYWNKRSEEGLNRAIEYFQLATKKEPQYALAYAGLADCYGIIGAAIVGTVPAREVAPKAEAAAIRAMEIDSGLAEAQTSLATVRMNYDWNWKEAESGFRRAIELDPNYSTAHQRYSLYLIARGRTEESITEMKRALWLDPLSISMNFSLGWRLYMAGQNAAAIQQLRIAVDMDPTFALAHLVLGQAYEQARNYAAAVGEFQEALRLSPHSPPVVAALAHVDAVQGKTAEARRLLETLQEQAKHQYVSPFYIALVYAGLGEQQMSIAWLQKAVADRSNPLIFLRVDPQFASLRNQPTFQALLHDLG